MDTPHDKLGEIIPFSSFFLSEQCMINLFSEYVNELPPFKDYLQLMFNNRRMMVKNRTTVVRVAHLAIRKRELLNTKKKTNIESTFSMLDIVFMGMPRMKKEIINTWKAT